MTKAFEKIYEAIDTEDEDLLLIIRAYWSCLTQDEKGFVTAAYGGSAGGGGGTGDPGTDVRKSFTPLNVNTSADHVLVSNTTLGNGAAISESLPYVVWNGRIYEVGNGDRDAAPFYLSTDSGATALAYTSFTTLANLYYNALTAAESMASTDQLLIVYRK